MNDAGTWVDFDRYNDETLIYLVRRAQPDALSLLYDRHSRRVYGIALQVTGDAHLAEEITQDVFLRVWEQAGTYDLRLGKAGSWIAGVARHRAIDVYRHHQTDAGGHSLPMSDLPLFDPPGDLTTEQEAAENDRNRQVRQALYALPEEQRAVLALAYYKGLTHEEMATVLGEPLGTIKTRIRLGMQKLRKLLEGERPSIAEAYDR